ncbi:hypothetical protein DDT56_17215 [Brenneria corticis]|uniref:Uncharacterized protein n=1 Tax=Brenneria corticis TaxID=2173106 RepID=A0A2U1TT92_9GAMM|nr:hypothetical protein DDT56_17215 [Brenneria sp. CFCC 11842]
MPRKLLIGAHRYCVAHILLSRTYKSNNFSQLGFVCAIPAQDEQIHNKKRILSTKKQMLILLVKKDNQRR